MGDADTPTVWASCVPEAPRVMKEAVPAVAEETVLKGAIDDERDTLERLASNLEKERRYTSNWVPYFWGSIDAAKPGPPITVAGQTDARSVLGVGGRYPYDEGQWPTPDRDDFYRSIMAFFHFMWTWKGPGAWRPIFLRNVICFYTIAYSFVFGIFMDVLGHKWRGGDGFQHASYYIVALFVLFQVKTYAEWKLKEAICRNSAQFTVRQLLYVTMYKPPLLRGLASTRARAPQRRRSPCQYAGSRVTALDRAGRRRSPRPRGVVRAGPHLGAAYAHDQHPPPPF